MTKLLRETHPHTWNAALRYPFGLHVVALDGERLPLLLVKLTQQHLLTARVNGGFKIYVVPVETPGGASIGLMSAFFEDDDNPLIVWTPLAADGDARAMIRALQEPALTVRLFDEHNRELLGYQAALELPLMSRVRLEHARLPILTHDLAHSMHEQGTGWFMVRTMTDDQDAISIRFRAPLYEESRKYIDDRPELFRFNGAKGLAEVRLEKDEPGQFQEIDIILLLQRVFKAESIYHAPRRHYDNEEIADVVVITEDLCLIIQAKDSPNTEKHLGNKLERKRLTAKKHLGKACDQLSGAINYLDRTRPLVMRMHHGDETIDVAQKTILTLAVVRELFPSDYKDYSTRLYELHDDIGLPCIAIDYGELVQYTAFCDSPEAFVGAYFEVFNAALKRQGFPRLRFGVRDLFDEDGRFRFS